MRIITNVKTLNDAYGIVARAVSQRTTLPITKGVLFEIKGNDITLTATDLEMRMTTHCEAESGEDGSIVIPAKLFGDIIRALPKEESVTIEDNDNKVSIRCMNSHFDIVAEDPSEFPKGENEKGKELVIPCETLKEMIERSIFATSSDEAKGTLTGELIEFNKDNFKIVAIDGFRMAIRKADIKSDEPISTIVPARALSEISRLLTSDDVTLSIGDKYIGVQIDNTKIETKILSGKFVDYTQIIPKDNNNRIRVNVSDFLKALERVLLVSETIKERLVVLDIDKEMEISSESNVGSAHEKVDITHQGEPLKIGFNGAYLLDALKSIEDEETDILFNTGVSPALFKPTDSEEYLYLTLPVRLH